MWNLTRWTLSINRQTESSIYGRLTPPRACSLSLFTFSDTEDEERGEKKKTLWWWWRAMPTQSSDNSDSKGVWESVSLTVFNNAALNWCKKTQLALSSHGLMGRLWFRLGHSELRLVCAHFESNTQVWECDESFFLISHAGNHSVVACARTCYNRLLYRLFQGFKVRAASRYIWLEGPLSINSAVK